jgi:PAS domain S-box-containing protein
MCTVGLATGLLRYVEIYAAATSGAAADLRLAGLIVFSAVIAVAALVSWQIRGEHRVLEQSMRLQEAIDALPDGFVLYDSDDRLVLANRRYRELHPDNAHCAAVGASFEEVFRTAIAVGEFPVPAADIDHRVRARLARHRDPKEPFEQPSGRRWLRISERKTAEGGIVAIHTDVTELKLARAAAEAAGTRLAEWAAAANDWFWECDVDGKITFLSDGFGKAIGIEPASRLGRWRFEIAEDYDPDAPRWREHLATLAARQPFRDFVFPVATKSGRRYVSTSAKPMRNAEGDFVGYRGSSTDVTPRIEAEQAADAARTRMAQFAATASDWFWESDAQGDLVFLSENFEASTGTPVAARIGARRLDLTPALDPENPTWDEHLALVAAQRPFRDFVMAVSAPNGRRVLSISGSPYDDGAGRFLGYRGTTRNVTSEREAEEALMRQTELLTSLIQNLPIGVSLIGPDLRLLAFNRVYTDMFGLPPDFLKPGDSIERFVHYNAAHGAYGDGDAEAIVRTRLEQVRAYEVQRYERRLPSGKVIEVRRVPLPDGNIITTLIDITEGRQRERDLIAAQGRLERQAQQLAAANAAKSQFLANMSHELRTPLNAILGFSEILRDAVLGPLDARYVEYASDIHSSGVHLLGLVNDLLDLSKIDAGKLELRDELVDLGEVIHDSCRLMSEKARAGGLSIILPDVTTLPAVMADRVRLKQILLNLLSNAVKFTSAGGSITISTTCSPTGLTIAIADTGIGMRPEDIPIALEPFRQIESSYARNHQGTGLGLPLAKSLTELHGGTFEIESQASKGTIVRVWLPPTRLAAALVHSEGSLPGHLVSKLGADWLP